METALIAPSREETVLGGIQRRASQPPGSSRRPAAAILTCVDERVVPESIFGSKPGSLYTVRLAGHVVTPEVVSSLEIALGLRCPLVFVLGHTDCSGVRLERERVGDHTAIVQHIRWATRGPSFTAGLDEAIEANVRHSVTELRGRLRTRGEGGILNLSTSRVSVLD